LSSPKSFKAIFLAKHSYEKKGNKKKMTSSRGRKNPRRGTRREKDGWRGES